MRSASALVLVVFACACNGSLGLDQVAVDDDRDGFLDTADNCPSIVNLDQEDWDADGIGDACDACDAPSGADRDADGIDDACDGCVGPGRTGDLGGDGVDNGCQDCPAATGFDVDSDGIDNACDTCSRGPNHDEDGDGRFDACDACPAERDVDQGPSKDGDRLGDACDPDDDPLDNASPVLTAQSTRMFEAFDAPTDNWTGAPWSLANDAGHAQAGSSHQALIGLGRRFLIETVLAFDTSTAGGTLTIGLYAMMCGQTACTLSTTSCSVGNDGTLSMTAYNESVAATSGVDVSGKVRLWYRSRSNAAGTGLDQLCVAVGANGNIVRTRVLGQPDTLPGIAHDVTFSTATSAVALDYVWFVSN